MSDQLSDHEDGCSDISDVCSDMEGDMYDDMDEPVESARPPFYVIDNTELSEHIESIIDGVANVIPGTSRDIIRSMMMDYKWDADSLIAAFMENGDCTLETGSCTADIPKNNRENIECGICSDITDVKNFRCLPCNHSFCLTCWSMYLTIAITGDNRKYVIHCPATKCKELVGDATVMQLTQADVYRAYQSLVADAFVCTNRNFRWCPYECGKAIHSTSSELCHVKCKCKREFCFTCGTVWHDPVPCKKLSEWHSICDKEAGNCEWLSKNTKECPKCTEPIEKNGGCNHMTCRGWGCRHEFCWLCLGDWKQHNYQKCSDFNNTSRDVSKRRSDMDRFVFFFERYKVHLNGLKCEIALAQKVKELANLHDASGITWTDYQHLSSATVALEECRTTLAYTYVLAFYLPENSHSVIFRENQANLQTHTEELADYLEHHCPLLIDEEPDPSNNAMDAAKLLSDCKDEVHAKRDNCNLRRKALLNHIEEGRNDYWAGIF